MSQNPCEKPMSAASISTEMSSGLRRLAEPVRAGESVKALIGKAARRAGLSYGRAFECWYGRAKVRAEEMDRVRALIQAKEQETINAEIVELRARLAALEEQVARGMDQVGPAAGE